MKSFLFFILVALFGVVFLGCNNIKIDPELTKHDFIIARELTRNDFTVEYNGFSINEDTTVEELVENLGCGNEKDYYFNNNGYISTIGEVQVFAFYYPDYKNTGLRVVYRKNILDETSFISFLDLRFETQRGIKIGDNEQKTIEAYGEPDKIKTSNGLTSYYYYFEEKSLQMMFCEGNIEFIAINFKVNEDE
jgi:hypothetical protein